jgi:protein gp37
MKNSEIDWTDHTFNPWWGCVKVSPACDNCYADKLSTRVGYEVWGKDAPRRMMSDNYWKEPLHWNAALKNGQRERVFCASMADIFERNGKIVEPRKRMWELIAGTPNLDWLLLTKRHDNVKLPWGDGTPWDNVWVGMTVENQEYADIRLPYLARVNAVVRFISAEPLLGAIDISKYATSIDWVICGGESGGNARAMSLDWARSLRDQCTKFHIPFHMKQWGNFVPLSQLKKKPQNKTASIIHGEPTLRLPKDAAGDLLDGKQWKESP